MSDVRSSLTQRAVLAAAVVLAVSIGFGSAQLVRATVMTFDIFDPTDARFSATEDFPEGYGVLDGVFTGYGSRVTSTSGLHANGTTTFGYADGGEGFTPNVVASFGPYSFFTGGPALWRYDYGDLTRVLFQGSTNTGIGNDYNILDIVLVADPGYDVVLYDFDLGGWNQTDYTINAVTVYEGVPFPFLTPTNDIFEDITFDVAGAGPTHSTVDFGVGGLVSHVIWLRIDANNLGALSENIGIDNIRFGQVANGIDNQPPVDLDEIDAAFRAGEIPEPSTLAIWSILGVAIIAGRFARRRTLSA